MIYVVCIDGEVKFEGTLPACERWADEHASEYEAATTWDICPRGEED